MMPLQTTRKFDAFVIQYNDISEQVGHYFRPFTILNLREILHLEKNPEHAPGISKSALQSEVCGVTIFEKLFKSSSGVFLNACEEQIQKICEQYEKDDSG